MRPARLPAVCFTGTLEIDQLAGALGSAVGPGNVAAVDEDHAQIAVLGPAEVATSVSPARRQKGLERRIRDHEVELQRASALCSSRVSGCAARARPVPRPAAAQLAS